MRTLGRNTADSQRVCQPQYNVLKFQKLKTEAIHQYGQKIIEKDIQDGQQLAQTKGIICIIKECVTALII